MRFSCSDIFWMLFMSNIESLRYSESWFIRRNIGIKQRFAIREILRFIFCSFLLFCSLMQQMLLNESTNSGILVFFYRSLPYTPTFRFERVPQFLHFPLGKYVPNELIECDQKPEHYLGIQCRWERGRGRTRSRKLSITVSSTALNWINWMQEFCCRRKKKNSINSFNLCSHPMQDIFQWYTF